MARSPETDSSLVQPFWFFVVVFFFFPPAPLNPWDLGPQHVKGTIE